MRGYVTDTPYADTFFRELSPTWLNYVAAVTGLAPRPLDEPFAYLELGCGFGTSTVLHAAAFPRADFHGCDINPQHIAGGRAYASALGVDNVTFHEESFESLLDRDLPPCRFIVLHGVYSWVDAAARATLRRVIDRRLEPGGFVYVSYNALPGWAHELPLRKLLIELAATEPGSAGAQGKAAAARLAKFREPGWRYFAANPGAAAAVSAYQRGEGEYLAHEFMNAAWEPFYSVDVADEFASIGLAFAGSATLPDNHLALGLDASVVEAIDGLASERQRHLAIDFARNQRFRRDLFTRGAAADPSAIHAVPVGCPGDVEDVGLSVRVPRGEIRFKEAFVRDVRQQLSQGSWRFGHLVAALAAAGQDASGIARNLLFMIAGGALAPFAQARRAPTAAPTRLASDTVARALRDIVARGHRRAVPSRVYGNGVTLDPAEAAAILEWADGRGGEAADRLLPSLARIGLVE